VAEKDVTVVEVIQEAFSHSIQGTSDSLNSDLSILEKMVEIGELVDPRWVQPSIHAGGELLAYARCPTLRKIAGPILEFRRQRTLEFMVGDIKEEIVIHPKYLHILDRWNKRFRLQADGSLIYKKELLIRDKDEIEFIG